ncbi:MAG: serine hydrolase, partial [Acidimicrobiales bacterium]
MADPELASLAAQVGATLVPRVGGVAVGLACRGVTHTTAFGRLDVGDSLDVGSITKVFTGLLLADMAQRDQVGVEDTVADHAPGGVAGRRWAGEVSLLDLATHASGLPSVPRRRPARGFPQPAGPYAGSRPDDLFRELPRRRPA